MARRLHCAIEIPAYQLEHVGEHVHSLDPKTIHRCEERYVSESYDLFVTDARTDVAIVAIFVGCLWVNTSHLFQ